MGLETPEPQQEVVDSPDPKAPIQEDTAKKLTEKTEPSPSEKLALEIEGLPEGSLKDVCRELYKEMKENPASAGSLSEGMLLLMILAARSQKYLDVIPTHYVKRIGKIDKKLGEDELNAVMTKHEAVEPELTPEKLVEYGSNADIASTRYVCDTLWHGKVKADNSDELAAKLLNTETDSGKAYYHPASATELKKMGMPYGTLVVLRANIKNPVNIVAFATGEKDQCRYFDVAEKKVFTINLSSTSFKVLTGIVPYFNSDPAYFDAQAEEGKEKFGLEPSLDRTIATELKKVSANGEKMRAEAERFDGLLSRDPSTQSFNASYLYDRVVENERLLDSLAARAQEISGVERMQLASVLETHKSLIETGLKCLEALERVEEAAGKTRVETEEIRKKMAYLRNESAKKMEEYTSKLKIPSE